MKSEWKPLIESKVIENLDYDEIKKCHRQERMDNFFYRLYVIVILAVILTTIQIILGVD